jgi:hypothetical protein
MPEFRETKSRAPFLKTRWNKGESLRAQREDQMLTRAMGDPLAEQVDANTDESVIASG